MSSLKNAAPQKTHKERSQLSSRSKYGLLEKKKDYKLRAKNYHYKQNQLKSFREKAQFKNPDEFYFGMINSKLKDGVHTDKNETYTEDALKLMRHQDVNYLKYYSSVNKKKLEKLQNESSHFVENEPSFGRKGRHTVFVDSKEEVDRFDLAEYLETAPELVDRTFNRPRLQTLQNQPILGVKNKTLAKSWDKAKVDQLTLIKSRLNRMEKLSSLEEQFQMKKKIITATTPRIKTGVSAAGKPIYKWKPERKR